MKRNKINVLSQLQSWLLHGKMQLGHSDNSNYPFKINFLICTVREQLRYSVSCCEVSYLASCSCSRNVTRSYTGLILYLVYIYYIPYTYTIYIYHILYTLYRSSTISARYQTHQVPKVLVGTHLVLLNNCLAFCHVAVSLHVSGPSFLFDFKVSCKYKTYCQHGAENT